jgi:CBS domain containing-hemolysin-like protein
MLPPAARDLLELSAVLLLILTNAFFVAAEFALIRIRRTRVAELVQSGVPRARAVQHAIQNLDLSIAATQLGITMAGLALGWVAQPALSSLIDPIVGLLPGNTSPQLAHTLSALLVFALVTFLTVVGGELAPKGIALRDPERTALAVAQPLIWIRAIFHPAVTILNGSGASLLRLLGFGPPTSGELAHTVEEIKMLVTASAESGVVEDQEEEMVHAVFDFGETLVRQVMVPRTEMEAVPDTAGVPTMLALAGASPHTRFPVYREDIDHILGVVHVPDLLRATQDPKRQDILASELMREVLFVPESAHVSQLLRRFQARHEQVAIVLDEYGGTAGLITLEDLLEEIVGEVGDPFDSETDLPPQPDGSSLIDGLTSIEEINERFGLDLSDPHYDTIAGFLLGRLGRLAHLGDSVTASGVRLRVEAMDGLRIARLSLARIPPSPSGTGAPTSA